MTGISMKLAASGRCIRKLLTMSDTTSEQPVVLEDEDDAFSAWLKRNHLDQGQPWLFYGEDELFIETV